MSLNLASGPVRVINRVGTKKTRLHSPLQFLQILSPWRNRLVVPQLALDQLVFHPSFPIECRRRRRHLFPDSPPFSVRNSPLSMHLHGLGVSIPGRRELIKYIQAALPLDTFIRRHLKHNYSPLTTSAVPLHSRPQPKKSFF